MSLTGDPKPAYKKKDPNERTVSEELDSNAEAVHMVATNSGLYHTNVP